MTSQQALPSLTDAQVDDQLAFLADRLPAPPLRVLDAGSGRGRLAGAMRRRGYDVTAIDADPDVVADARAEGGAVVQADITRYDDRPFDALLFSLSLHHVHGLVEAVDQARALVKPGGLLVLDEFAWDRADRATAAWFYDTAELLTGAGVLSREPDTGAEDPLVRWVRRHHDEDPMHPGRAMIDAVADRFELRETRSVPYLYRYLGGWLTDDADGARLFATVRDVERRRVADGGLAAVGLQVVAVRA
jgi:SAM-dependent methyltransferase